MQKLAVTNKVAAAVDESFERRVDFEKMDVRDEAVERRVQAGGVCSKEKSLIRRQLGQRFEIRHSAGIDLLRRVASDPLEIVALEVVFTRFPEGLARALRKIQQENLPMASASAATAHLYIANPFTGRSVAALFSTHPPIEQRIAALEKMAQP